MDWFTINQTFQQFDCSIQIHEAEIDSTKLCVCDYLIFAEEVCVGFVYGLYLKQTNAFLVKKLFLAKEVRKQSVVICVLEEFFRQVHEEFAPANCFWRYTIEEAETDSYFLMMKKVFGVRVEKKRLLKEYLVRTEDFNQLRSLLWWNPKFFQEKGYQAICWQECSEEVKRKILEKEAVLKQEKSYLSPFFEEETVAVDADSFVLVEESTQNPLGWMMNERVDEQCIKIKRWYTYAQLRALRVAPSFASYVLEKIAEKSKYLNFEVAIDNVSMDKIVVNRYFHSILAKISTVCQLEIFWE